MSMRKEENPALYLLRKEKIEILVKPHGHEHDVGLEVTSYLLAEIDIIQLPTKTP